MQSWQPKATAAGNTGDGGTMGAASSSPVAPLLLPWEAAIVQQVEFYFSDDNLPRDKFLNEELRKCRLASDKDKSLPKDTVPLSMVAEFRKMKRLLRNASSSSSSSDGRLDGSPAAIVARVLRKGSSALVVYGLPSEDSATTDNDGTAAAASSSSSPPSSSVYRVGRAVPLPAELSGEIEANRAGLLMRTVVVHRLPRHSSVESVRATFSACGEICAVRIPTATSSSDGGGGGGGGGVGGAGGARVGECGG